MEMSLVMMLSWFSDNIGSIIILLVLVAICVGAVYYLVKKHKKGGCGSSCGGNCSLCHKDLHDAMEEIKKEEKEAKK